VLARAQWDAGGYRPVSAPPAMAMD